MPHPYYPSGNPRFNHVALSLPAELLAEEGRKEICAFWSSVFGFEEMPGMSIDRQRLILSCVHWDQFLFLVADDQPMRCPRLDHFGFSVGTLEELEGLQERASAFRRDDERVDLIDLHVDDQGPVKIHSLYVRYLLPMMCEVQWWEFTGSPR
ncbi:MAG: VOC family protein [Acidimicrobiales bacterium]